MTAHTAQVISELDGEAFAASHDTTWKRRGEDYEALKLRITDGLLAFADHHIPGLRDLVYGLPALPEKFRTRWLDVQTPIEGLLLTSSDVGSLGITGAAMGGVMTMGKVLGMRADGKVMHP